MVDTLAIDAVGAKHGGAAVVALALAAAAIQNPGLRRIIIFSSPRRMRAFDFPLNPRLLEVEVPRAERGPVTRLAWHLTGLGVEARRWRASALLCLSGSGVAPVGIPATLLVQQSIPFSEEAMERLTRIDRLRFRVIALELRLASRRAGLIMVQTPTMKQWVGAALGHAAPRIEVFEPNPPMLPLAQVPDPALEPMRRIPPGKRLLYVGNTSAYKNLRILPAAMRELQERMPGTVLFATMAPNHEYCRSGLITGLGTLSPSTLREAYGLTRALVMPSLVETVGLPLLEAASLGVPVIVADRPYARDVCGTAAMFFDPLNPSCLARAATDLLGDERLHETLVAGGRAMCERRSTGQPYPRMIAELIRMAEEHHG